MKGVKVSNFIVPMSVTDTYPTNLDIFGRGGIHSVDTIPNRDSITTERRSEGMLSFTKNNESMYALLGGITNDKWFKLFDFSDNKINFNIACDTNYVLLGNKDGVAKPSPTLIDVQFDIINLRRKIDKVGILEYNHIWIGDYTNRSVAQKTIGVNNLPLLGAAQFPLPFSLESIALPNPTFSPTSPLAYIMSGAWLPQIYAGNPGKLDYTQTETIISSSLAMTQIKVAQALKRIDQGGLIVKSKNISFLWENPLANAIPEEVAQLYDYGTTYTFDKAQALDEIDAGLLKQNVGQGVKGDGQLVKAISGEDYVDAVVNPIGFVCVIDPLFPNVSGRKLISPSTQRVRKKQPNEFSAFTDVTVATPIFDVLALKSKYLNVGSITQKLIKGDNEGNIVAAIDGEDYISPSDETYATLAETVANILGSKIIKNEQQGTAPLATIQEANIVAKKTREETHGTSSTALDVAAGTLGVALVVGAAGAASVVALPGVALAGTAIAAAALFDYIFKPFGSKEGRNLQAVPELTNEQKINYTYGLLTKGGFLNTNNTYKSVDLNDYAYLSSPWIGENGQFNFKFCDTLQHTLGFDVYDRGKGTLWFDSWGKSRDTTFGEKSEPGLRIFSWNSGGDGVDYQGEGLAPLHIGLFGYDAPRSQNVNNRYNGFILRSEFYNLPGNLEDKTPENFGLYLASKSFSSSQPKAGFDSLNTIFEYDLTNFNFEKPVKFNKNFILPVIKKADIPLNPPLGMVLLVEF